MNGILKVVLWIVGVLALFMVIGAVIFFSILFPAPISKTKMDKIFIRDQDMLVSIIDYFENSNYTNISITSSDYIYDTEKKGTMFVYNDPNDLGKSVQIENPEMLRILDILFNEKGYEAVSKKGNTIHFQCWSRLQDVGRGIAYTIDGSAPELEFLTDYATLSEDHWYYYEDDFNEYKRRMEND